MSDVRPYTKRGTAHLRRALTRQASSAELGRRAVSLVASADREMANLVEKWE